MLSISSNSRIRWCCDSHRSSRNLVLEITYSPQAVHDDTTIWIHDQLRTTLILLDDLTYLPRKQCFNTHINSRTQQRTLKTCELVLARRRMLGSCAVGVVVYSSTHILCLGILEQTPNYRFRTLLDLLNMKGQTHPRPPHLGSSQSETKILLWRFWQTVEAIPCLCATLAPAPSLR